MARLVGKEDHKKICVHKSNDIELSQNIVSILSSTMCTIGEPIRDHLKGKELKS